MTPTRAAMGTATDAINGLALPEAQRELLVAHIAVADAVCYLFGYAGVIIFSRYPKRLAAGLLPPALQSARAHLRPSWSGGR